MLYLVATPIGNLKDISFRAIEVLKGCDIIACEDTRRTIKLLNHYEIKKKLISYHLHNRYERAKELLEMAKEGKTIVLVSDAGCPGISDPGEHLVQVFHENNLKVSVIPGASAFVSALMVSGLSTKSFIFIGFLSQENKEKKEQLEILRAEKRTMIFYEAPHRLLKTLTLFESYFEAEREIAVVKELTKIYEKVIKGTIAQVKEIYKDKTPKGEFVIVVSGGTGIVKEIKTNESIEQQYERLLKENYNRKDAMRIIAKEKNISRREVYKNINSD